jgi:peptidoglycan/LPS O-acetylase OafA/YrhL
MNEIKTLTSLRGIAALAVVMQHFSTTAQSLTNTVIPSLVPHGYVAVDFFFILSGFIMCYTYSMEFNAIGWRAFPSFISRRIVRLFPLNIFVVLLIIVLSEFSKLVFGVNIFLGFDFDVVDVIANLMLVQGYGIGRNMNGPSWSVSLELFAYFLFPVFMYFVFHRNRIIFVVTIGVAVAVLGYLASLHSHLGLSFEDAIYGGMRCFSEFLLGMATYRIYSTKNYLAKFLGIDLVQIVAYLSCVGFLVMKLDLPAALLFTVIVPGTALNAGVVNRFLSLPVFYFLGVISYSAYLIHNMFRPIESRLMIYFHPTPLDGIHALLFAFVASLSILPFAWMSYRCIEYPSRKVLRRLLGIS